MGESLNQPSSVQDDGPLGCKLLLVGNKKGTCPFLYVPSEKGPANSVPAAAVIRKVQALSGFIGFKGSVGGLLSQRLKGVAQPCIAVETGDLECRQGCRNSWCSGEMLRYHEELRSRRQVSGLQLTLRLESVGIKQD